MCLHVCVFVCADLASLPAQLVDGNKEMPDEHEEEAEEEDVDDESRGSRQHKTLLLVYRIMYYPTFDWYAFPSQSESTLVNAVSRPTLDDRVSSTLQAR